MQMNLAVGQPKPAPVDTTGYKPYPRMLYHQFEEGELIVNSEAEENEAVKKGWKSKSGKEGRIDLLKARVAYYKEQIEVDEKEIVLLDAARTDEKNKQADIKKELAQKLIHEANDLTRKVIQIPTGKSKCPHCVALCDSEENLQKHIEKKHPDLSKE